MIAQLGWPDMRLPLLYSISWPHRIAMDYKPLDLVQLGSLTFKVLAGDHLVFVLFLGGGKWLCGSLICQWLWLVLNGLTGSR